MKLILLYIALGVLLSTIMTNGLAIDSAVLGSLAVPVVMQMGSLASLGAGYLMTILKTRPNSQKFTHVTPHQFHGPHGPYLVQDIRHTEQHRPHYPSHAAALPHPPAHPHHLLPPPAYIPYHPPYPYHHHYAYAPHPYLYAPPPLPYW